MKIVIEGHEVEAADVRVTVIGDSPQDAMDRVCRLIDHAHLRGGIRFDGQSAFSARDDDRFQGSVYLVDHDPANNVLTVSGGREKTNDN